MNQKPKSATQEEKNSTNEVRSSSFMTTHSKKSSKVLSWTNFYLFRSHDHLRGLTLTWIKNLKYSLKTCSRRNPLPSGETAYIIWWRYGRKLFIMMRNTLHNILLLQEERMQYCLFHKKKAQKLPHQLNRFESPVIVASMNKTMRGSLRTDY